MGDSDLRKDKMARFYLNRNQQPNGDYEVHRLECGQGAAPNNQVYLGEFLICQDAVIEAKRRFPEYANLINGCYYCCKACHTS